MQMIKKTGKILTYSLGALAAGGSLAALHRNDWNLSSLGIIRFTRSAATAGVVVADYKISLNKLDPSTDLYWRVKSKVHKRSAERLRDLCCSNRGAYIKIGQHLGALDYLLPAEYVETLRVLHSDAPQSPREELYQVIEEDLGKKVDELFTSFEDKPIGAASLAQVHRATLLDGTPVAVKVQHLHVKSHAFIDMATMELMVNIVAWLFPEFQFKWLAEESKKNLPLELDFVHEAKNCERVAKLFSNCHFLKVPKIYWGLTTERILTMEYCQGGQVNDKSYIQTHGISESEVSKKLGELYSEMIFVHGYIHCDPHPGNVLVNKTSSQTQIVLLDHGLYQTLPDDIRLNYAKLWRSILQTKLEGIRKYSERLGIGRFYPLFACMVTGRSWESISKGVDKQAFTKTEEETIKENVAVYLPEISNILNSIPRQMLLIFKTNDLLRGIETSLETRANMNSFITMSRACVRAVSNHKRHKCAGFMCRLKITMSERWYLSLLTVYQLFLWIKGTSLGKRFLHQSSQDIIKLAIS